MTTARIVFIVLSMLGILACAVAQHREARRIDEWEALEISLRGAASVRPKNGFIPDEGTAVIIAEAVAAAQYGDNTIARERPFRARLRDGVWTVMGTVHPEGAFGGTAVIKLSKTDGKVLFLTHQQ